MPQFIRIQRTNLPEVSLLDTIETISVKAEVSLHDKVEAEPVDTSRNIKQLVPMDIILFLLPLFAIFLWSISLQQVSVKNMNDLGLISVLSPKIIAGLCILMISFALTLQRREFRVWLLALHVVCIILIVYGTPNLIEQAPHQDILYTNAAYTEYIMRKGAVDPNLGAYFNWTGFFVLSAFVTKVSGYTTILSYAGWAPIFFNLIYFGPMYMIFTSITANKRLVWLSFLFFYITNWVDQDYFSPQGLDFFLYLVIIAMLLKWFRKSSQGQTQRQSGQTTGQPLSIWQSFVEWFKTPDSSFTAIQPLPKRSLLFCLFLIFGLIVSSHPLTPFFTIISVFLLVVFRRCQPSWLPFLMIAMTVVWIFTMAWPFVSQNTNMILGTFGDLNNNVPKSITSGSFNESPLYQIIAKLRLYMTMLIWLLAFVGGMKRFLKGYQDIRLAEKGLNFLPRHIKRFRQGYQDITYILLAIGGFFLIGAQKYGGEMLLRIYLFSLPFMVFFAATLFCGKPTLVMRKTSPWMTTTIITFNLILLVGFLFTRYGDERVNYKSYNELNAIQYLYETAPANSFFLVAWNNVPLPFENFEKYDIKSLTYSFTNAVINTNAGEVIKFIKSEHKPKSYVIFTQGEQAEATAWDGMPPDILHRLEAAVLQSGEFKLIYSNTDAQILQFIE